MASEYITMNRFKIKPEFADAYLKVWQGADVSAKSMPGLLEFRFFRLEIIFDKYQIDAPQNPISQAYPQHKAPRSYEPQRRFSISSDYLPSVTSSGFSTNFRSPLR